MGTVYLCLVDVEVFDLLRETRAAAAVAFERRYYRALEEHHSHLQPEVKNVPGIFCPVDVLSRNQCKRPIDLPSKLKAKCPIDLTPLKTRVNSPSTSTLKPGINIRSTLREQCHGGGGAYYFLSSPHELNVFHPQHGLKQLHSRILLKISMR